MNNCEGKRVRLNLEFYSNKDCYSDGDIEDEILSIVKGKTDFSEILKNDNRWPILYHLTPLRRNLLEWYNFRPKANLLEIGAGCGVLTELFCEKVDEVTAVELSKKRSEIIAHRCKDKSNLEIIVGNLNDIKFDKKFDYVTLIGVLEYAGIFTNTANPYKDFLSQIKRYIKPDGILIIALENKFGLKYWAGAREDHTRKFFDNIENYPNDNGVITFGKDELMELLNLSGFNDIDFYYPMPDYKIPTKIFSDDYLPRIGQIEGNSPNYDNDRLILFNEKIAYENIIKNNKFDFFANSFLIFCKIEKECKIIYSKFNRERLPRFQTETSIYKENGVIFAKKKALGDNALKHIKDIYANFLLLQNRSKKIIRIAKANLQKNEIVFEYINGTSFDKLLLDSVFQRDKFGFLNLITEYIQLINNMTPVKKGKFKTDSKFAEIFREKFELNCTSYLEVANIDLIFENIIIDEEGNYTIIDYEWVFDFAIPLNYILYRSIINLFFKYKEYLQNFISREEIFDFCRLNAKEIKIYDKMEINFQAYVMSKNENYKISEHYLKRRKKIKESSCSILREILRRPKLLFKKGAWLENIKPR